MLDGMKELAVYEQFWKFWEPHILDHLENSPYFFLNVSKEKGLERLIHTVDNGEYIYMVDTLPMFNIKLSDSGFMATMEEYLREAREKYNE